MGRSVEVPSNAAVTFFYFDENAPIDSYYNDNFEFASEDFVYDLLAEFPSLSGFVGRSNQFEHGRETVTMAYNWLADITVSRYGSLVAVSMVPSLEYRGLALNWISQVEDKVREFGAVFGTEVRRRGTFSNGEGVYERIA